MSVQVQLPCGRTTSAATAYDALAKAFFGEFAVTNGEAPSDG